MHDQYDNEEKAKNFDTWRKASLFLRHIVNPSLKKLIGNDLSGKRCIDLACGTAESTRLLADLDPLELYGLDLSPHMIELAKKNCSQYPKYSKIHFITKDCLQPFGLGSFDLVFSVHFLTYANTKENLAQMVQTMYDATKPGGLCMGLMMCPFMDRENVHKLHKYGVEFTFGSEVEMKARLFFGHVKDGKFVIELDSFQWDKSVHEECFAKCGFVDFKWINMELDDSYVDKDDFLKDFIDVSPNIAFSAVRPL